MLQHTCIQWERVFVTIHIAGPRVVDPDWPHSLWWETWIDSLDSVIRLTLLSESQLQLGSKLSTFPTDP